MNLEYFRESLELISYAGITLNPEEIILIENSLIVLQNENKLKNMFFWGRINGIEKDYYISFGYEKDCLSQRKYFYSTNGYQWIMLSPAQSEFDEATILCHELFLGDPTILTTIPIDPKFEYDNDGKIVETECLPVKVKEEDRLSCVINLITEESALLPRGGLFKTVDSNTIFNPLFHGLNEVEATELTAYQIYREPQNKWNYNLLKRKDYNYPIDFLDTIKDVVPDKEAFSLTVEKSGGLILIKSLLWPGMMFFHKIKSRKHGFVYFGYAKKNFDLLFMY